MTKQKVGIIGMAVMGKNLALNIESRGYTISIFNRTISKAENVLRENPDRKIFMAKTIEEFVQSLETPRRIIMMVQAGNPTDLTIKQLLPHLEEGDILVDGGNTFFKETIRRNEILANSNIHFIGMGVSGGEEGALKGPALMPGGQKEAYDLVEPILKDIAAKANDGKECVAYMGPDGAGHYVKMVHNGIEYGDMQLIAEAYDLLRRLLKLSVSEIADVFKEWNMGELNSYLIEITADLLKVNDEETGKPMVDVILDQAGNKGTGKWTSQSALDSAVPLPLITESVFARFISSMKDERKRASKVLAGPSEIDIVLDKDKWIENIRQALYFSKIVSYAQGFAQLKIASNQYNWNLNNGKIAEVFRAGCIIRAQFLQRITEAFNEKPELENILISEYFVEVTKAYQHSVREVAKMAIEAGIPVPTFSSAISYYDSYRSEQLPANLIQAQRDFFGAHTFERIDKKGEFHYEWMKNITKT